MKTISCKDMGQESCDFVAKAESQEALMAELKAHAQEKHPDVWEDKMKDMSDEEIGKMMTPHIKEE